VLLGRTELGQLAVLVREVGQRGGQLNEVSELQLLLLSFDPLLADGLGLGGRERLPVGRLVILLY